MVFGSLVAWYLFFGGTAAGSFAILAVVDLGVAFSHAHAATSSRLPRECWGRRARSVTQRRLARVGYSASFVLLLVALLCLLADLGRPQAFYLLFLYPTSSFVSLGAFSLALFGTCLVLVLAESLLTLSPFWEKVALAAKALGFVLAVMVMTYTGLLLKSVVAVELWQSVMLPALFLLSALSCGCGVVMLSACACETSPGSSSWARALSAADIALIVLELLSAVVYAATLGLAGEGAPFAALVRGGQAPLFWLGFVGCGILAPLVAEIAMLARRQSDGSAANATVAVLVLVGGLSLRFALVNAGINPLA